MVFISHDIQTVRYISDDIIVMNGGKIVEQGEAKQVFQHPQDPYTKMLLGAAPSLLHPKLGAEGVLAGVKDSSGDDISFRYLVQENEKNGHPMSILTGHEVVVDGAYLGGADGSVPGLANVEPEGYVRQWKAAQAGDWASVKAEQDRLNEISHIWDVTSGVQGYAGGVGAFKTAMNLMGIFDSPTMPRPVKAMTGENVEAIRKVLQDTRSWGSSGRA